MVTNGLTQKLEALWGEDLRSGRREEGQRKCKNLGSVSLCLLCFLLMVVCFFGSLRAEGLGGAPMGGAPMGDAPVPVLYSEEEERSQSQALAREFTPCMLEGSDRVKDIFFINRVFQTEFTLQNTGPSYKNHTTLWCSLPLCNGYNQIVPKVSASHEARIYKDTFGNLFLRFDIRDIPPYATQMVRVDGEILKSKQPEPSADEPAAPIDGNSAPIDSHSIMDQMKPYLMEDELLEVTHPKIQELAQKLNQGKSVKTARKIFDWVAENVIYTGYDPQDKGALHSLTYREGDCTEQAALFTALCRADDIPSKLIIGYRCQGNCQGGERLHTWAEFFADGAWHLVDITNRVFDAEYENYIGLVNYHSTDPNPLGGTHRYRMDFTYEDVKTRIDITSIVRLRYDEDWGRTSRSS